MAIIIFCGIVFRFSSLENKVLTGDETVSLLRTSGYTFVEWQELAVNTEDFTTEKLVEYQYPNQNKSYLDTIIGLAKEEPQHPPLYFILLKYWLTIFGNSVAVARTLSVIFSVAMLPLIYFLCRELFNNKVIGYYSMALLAVSPFQILYAQDIRSYSLWGLTILLSSWLLLRAIRINNTQSWITYSISLVLGFYTFFFSLLTTISHVIYVMFLLGWKQKNIFMNYLLSVGTSIILFVPWIVTIIYNSSNVSSTTDWTSKKFPVVSLIKNWVLNLSRLFVDYNYNFINKNILMTLAICLLVFLVIYCHYFLIKNTSKETWLFILTLEGIIPTLLIMADLFLGGRRSSVARYFIPSFLSILLCVSYCLYSLTVGFQSQKMKKLGHSLFAILISLGIFSGVQISLSQSWWNKYLHIFDPQIADIVNNSPNPVLITNWMSLMQLKHQMSDKVTVIPLENIINNAENKHIEKLTTFDNNEIFIYTIYKKSKNIDVFLNLYPQYKLEKVYEWKKWIEPVFYTEIALWKLNKS